MTKVKRFSAEVRERAVRLVLEHEQEHPSQWAAIVSIAEKVGCSSETLRNWVRQAERDERRRPGLTKEEQTRLRELERENRDWDGLGALSRGEDLRAEACGGTGYLPYCLKPRRGRISGRK